MYFVFGQPKKNLTYYLMAREILNLSYCLMHKDDTHKKKKEHLIAELRTLKLKYLFLQTPNTKYNCYKNVNAL